MANEPQAKDPLKEAVGRATIQIVAGAIILIVGVALLLWGSPTQPGQRRNALWLALEQAMGYNGTCYLFIGLGSLMGVYGIYRTLKLKKQKPQ